MLKSLFESSIDKLHIPADMKDAIKQINNICLEAEGDDKEKDLGYTPLGEEDKKKADQIKADQERKEKAEKDKQKEMEANGLEPENPPTWNNKDYDYNVFKPNTSPNSQTEEKKTSNQEAEKVPTSIDDAETDDDIWKVLKNLQQKAVANKGTTEGEKWRQKLEDEYWKATNDRNFKRVKGFELTINNPEYKKAKTDDKAAETKPAEQPAQATGEQPAKNAETKTTEQPAQNTGAQPAQNAEGQQAKPADGKAAEQPAAAQQKPTAKRGADVATVQYFLQSALPNSNIVADGILGPKTITAIQQKEDIDTTGKMDENTQNAFNKLLAEAKKKVIPLQEKLGVTADGLIGKQTLQAMAKQNMHVANVFSKDVKNANTPAGNTNVATKKADVNLLDTPFDAAKAEKALASKEITKAEYNTWKGFGISPQHQRENPKETKAECIRLAHYTPAERQQVIQERLAKNNPKTEKTKPAVGAGNNKNVAEVAANVKGPQNDAEKKFFKQTKENWTKVYTEKFKNDPSRVEPAAEQQARIELMKYRARMAQAARQNAQQQVAQQQGGQQNNQQQVAANGNTTPAQKAAPQQKQPKQGTQYYSGKVSYINLPPDEKKVYDEAEKKYLDANMKWGKNEQMTLDQAALAASTAVLKYRAQKGGNQNG